MKTKTKNKSSRSKKQTQYPAYYLAIVLAAVLLLEGVLIGVATPQAWQHGLQILDVSSGASVVVSDFMEVIDPMFVVVDDVTQFYHMAASEMIVMLDVSDTADPLAFFRGVNEFYRLASIEMEKMLDMSPDFEHVPQVAGAAIFR